MAFTWTDIVNSTTNDAVEVINNFYHIRRDNLLPLAGTGMNPTDAALDVGDASFQWRDGRFSRDLYARSIRGQATPAGYLSWSSYPNSPVLASVTANSGPTVIIPPFKAELNGQMYVHAATTTLDFATTTAWISGQSNATASTFVWVYAVGTTTGNAVVLLDDEQPVATFNTTTSGFYHPSTTAQPNARAVHVMRINSASRILPYVRNNDWMFYQKNTTTSVLASSEIIYNSFGSSHNFSTVPDLGRTVALQLCVHFVTIALGLHHGHVFATEDSAVNNQGNIIYTLPPINGIANATSTSSPFVVPSSGNSLFMKWEQSSSITVNATSTAASVSAHLYGYKIRW
ncbi:MAG: hypothetical protein V3W19_01905 [Desulfatiglandales bacterium]